MINEIGKKYGKLTVVSKAPKSPRQIVFWNCLCDCGNKTITSGVDLRKGESKSCGKCNRNYQKVPMIGKRFAKLIVLEETSLRTKITL